MYQEGHGALLSVWNRISPDSEDDHDGELCCSPVRTSDVPVANVRCVSAPETPRPTSDLREEDTVMDDEKLYEAVRRACEKHDPMPAGMVDRIVTVVGELARHDADLEFELMLVVERFRELVGTRGGAQSYTLRFGAEDVELLVRVSTADDEGRARLDGWLVPALSGPVQVREVEGEKRTYDGSADVNGRFEFPDVPAGFYRLWLELPDSHTFGTPAFEI